MPSLITNAEVETCVRDILAREGYALSKQKAHGETGPDIVATKDAESWYVEIIGFKSSPPVRARDFFEVFFRALSRLNDGATHCAIALPRRFSAGLPARASQYRVAWQRIGKAIPELEIWLVDAENHTYERTSWLYWLDTSQ